MVAVMNVDSVRTIDISMLTDKQQDALNLLIQHKTSKEISRILGVSPHTVDQRIDSARRKLGVASRGELAQTYRQLLMVCERLTYEETHIAEQRDFDETSIPDITDTSAALLDPNWSKQEMQKDKAGSYQVIPELFSGPKGTAWRLVAILVIAVMLVVTVLGGIAIFVQLTEILTA
jgi:DNA-binding CsgD family transcriptional regulator